jgi:hypothetical protein
MIPVFVKVTEDSSKVSGIKETWDILQKRESWSYTAYGTQRFRPLVSVVLVFSSLSGDAERLARESRRNDVNHSFIFSGDTGETSDISEHRRFIKISIRYPPRDYLLAIRVIFNIPDNPVSEHMLRCQQPAPTPGKK